MLNLGGDTVSGEHFENGDSEGPPITGLGVALAFQNLRKDNR